MRRIAKYIMALYIIGEFAMVLYYARSMQFEEKPDYLYIQGVMNSALMSFSPSFNPVFDWIILRVFFIIQNE